MERGPHRAGRGAPCHAGPGGGHLPRPGDSPRLPARDPVARVACGRSRPGGLAAGFNLHRQHVRHEAARDGARVDTRWPLPVRVLPGARAGHRRHRAGPAGRQRMATAGDARCAGGGARTAEPPRHSAIRIRATHRLRRLQQFQRQLHAGRRAVDDRARGQHADGLPGAWFHGGERVPLGAYRHLALHGGG